MANKHKAPTQVTLIQEEKSSFATWIDNNWKMLAFAAIAISAGIIGTQVMGQKEEASRHNRLDILLGAIQSADPGQLETASNSLKGTGLAGWADLMATQLALAEGRYDDADAGLARLQTSASSLLSLQLPLGAEGESMTILEHLAAAKDGSRQLVQDSQITLFSPDPPEGSPRVRMQTSLGAIEIALYEEAAPLHVANFLANVDADKYTGTRFHRILQGFMVQGGNPATTSDDPTQWIEADDEVKVPTESGNGLVHSPYVLAGAMFPGDEDSSQYQFYITEGHAHWLDEKHTVYGKVVSGQDTVRALGSVMADPQSGRPTSPPVLERVERF